MNSSHFDGIVTADNHLRWLPWRSRRAIYGDSLVSFKQIVDLCLVSGPGGTPVKFLVLAGDFWDDPNPDLFTVHFVHTQLDLLREANVRVFFVLGQHDMVVQHSYSAVSELGRFFKLDRIPRTLLELHPWPTYVHGQIFHIGGFTAYGLDYQTPDKVLASLQQVPPVDILVTHQVWKDFIGDGAVSLADVPAHAHNIISGDYHHTITEDRGGHFFMSPGSTCLQALNEPAEKFVLGLRISSSRLEVEKLLLLTRGAEIVRVNGTENFNDVVAACRSWLTVKQREAVFLPDATRKPLLRVVVDKALGAAIAQKLLTVLGDQAHVLIQYDETEDVTEEPGTFASLEVIGAEDLLKELCTQNDRMDLYNLALRAYKAEDPTQEADLIANDLIKETV